MAVASMQKVMIVVHRSQVSDLLRSLQDAGIVQILDAERALVTIEWPELMVEARRHRELEESIGRLAKAIGFLKPYAPKGQTSLFAPLVEVDHEMYSTVTAAPDSLRLLDEVESVSGQMETLAAEVESSKGLLEKLMPWETLSIPVEDLHTLSSSTTFVGLVPDQHLAQVREKLSELGAAIEKVAAGNRVEAWIIVALNESASDVQKALRLFEFEAASFEGLAGQIADNIARIRSRLDAIGKERAELTKKAAALGTETLKLQILSDHYENLHGRIHAESSAPATDHTVFLEGWAKQKDYPALEKLVTGFDACDIAPVEPGVGEEIPVEIDNGAAVRPFETITRLYGIPAMTDVDPTVFLAPFFAVFFGLCLTDAGYGIVLVVLLAWVLKKLQGDKKAIWMLLICSGLAVIAGAITGGWFADTIQTLLPQGEGRIGTTLEMWRQKLMLFDPMEKPLVFIGISLALGYIQVLFGLGIAFFNLLRQKRYAAAVFEKLTWLILLNCILLYALAKNGVLAAGIAPICGIVAMVQVALIFWFTERSSGLAGRIGGGAFAVFSTVFYMGDMLSYVRLMALGMVTAGLGMAVNILTKLLMDVPYIGFILGMLMFVGGHAVNLALSLLSAFVHSLRLQFVEFFPKFFGGGGQAFTPLRNDYRQVMIVQNETRTE